MAAGSFLLSVGVAIGISSFLSKPIHVLHDAMDEVQEGNLDTHVPSFSTARRNMSLEVVPFST